MDAVIKHKLKIHLWGFVSISIIILIYWNLEFFNTPWWVPVLFLSWLTKSRNQLKILFHTPLPKRHVLLIFGVITVFVGYLIFCVLSGPHESDPLSNEVKRFFLFIYATFIGVAYGMMVKSGKNA